MPFDGETYSRLLDQGRLAGQFLRVKYLLTHPRGQWWPLAELHALARGSEAGISARIRDLRKRKFGAFPVESKRLAGGVWLYRVREDSPRQQVLKWERMQ